MTELLLPCKKFSFVRALCYFFIWEAGFCLDLQQTCPIPKIARSVTEGIVPQEIQTPQLYGGTVRQSSCSPHKCCGVLLIRGHNALGKSHCNAGFLKTSPAVQAKVGCLNKKYKKEQSKSCPKKSLFKELFCPAFQLCGGGICCKALTLFKVCALAGRCKPAVCAAHTAAA